MPADVARIAIGAVLVSAGLAKLLDPRAASSAMETFGFAGAISWLALGTLVVTELVLGVAVAAGSTSAAWLGAVVLAFFALVLVGALMRGRAGAPCACFGPSSRISWASAGRTLALAAACAVLALL